MLNRQNHHNTEQRRTFFHTAAYVTALTVGTLLLGGSGKGGLEDLRLTTAPMVEISLSNMALTALVWTSVRCGDSLACMHVRIYCKQDRTGMLFSYAHICAFAYTKKLTACLQLRCMLRLNLHFAYLNKVSEM